MQRTCQSIRAQVFSLHADVLSELRSIRNGAMNCIRLLIAIMGFGDFLRGALAAAAAAKKKPQVRKYRNEKVPVEGRIEVGHRIQAFMKIKYGEETTEILLQELEERANGSQPMLVCEGNGDQSPARAAAGHMPHGFWKMFCLEEMKVAYTSQCRQKYARALKYYVLRRAEGAQTLTSMRGMRKPNSCRSDGGAMNAQKARGLGWSLLQWFVDHVQRLRTRSDSLMLLTRARDLAADLDFEGVTDLPKLEGNAGAQWFKRWRAMYGITKKVTGMKLKVPWAKVKRRVKVLLGNIFRLRAFWEICHPGTEMRFLSLDQKPSWFNNAGLTGTFAKKGGAAPTVREDFEKTRERYSILTAVPSWGHGDPDLPPKVAVLFRAEPNGPTIRRLRRCPELAPWMKVQVQSFGSYRSENVVEALDWIGQA